MLSLEIFTNIFIPILSGFFLFMYFMYLVVIEEIKTKSTKYFLVFLMSFGFFLIGRPFQVLLGPHPNPLIINNIRSFIFSAITIPSLILADFFQTSENKKNNAIGFFITGTVLGIIYCIFNTLNTSGAKIIFSIGAIFFHDSITPYMKPPFYGREVTIVVYLSLAILLFVDSIRKIRSTSIHKNYVGMILKRVYLYNTGKILFAITFFLGSLLKQWWIYYLGSIFSATFLGYGVLQSIKEKRTKLFNVISYIKENLIQELSIDVHIHRQVSDMLTLLNIPDDINTFIAVKESSFQKNSNLTSLYMDEAHIKDISNLLGKKLGKNQFILMPMGSDMLGICFSVSSNNDSGRAISVGICESLKMSLDFMKYYDFGIGRSYTNLDQLKNSYKEAVYAVEYTNSILEGQIIHIDDIQNTIVRREYPLNEKNEFLSAIKVGDRDKAMEKLEILNAMLLWYCNEGGRLLKVRIYELIGAIIESGMSGGGNIDDLLKLSEKLYTEAAMICSYSQVTEWLRSRTNDVITIISKSHSNRVQNVVKKAMLYIDEHYSEPISVKDVANAVCISESYLKALFKKCENKSYIEYLIETRINKAKILLRNSDKSITEISLDVGYQTPNAFSSVFKKVTGTTPSQYKKILKK